jgi:hypothetical protein
MQKQHSANGAALESATTHLNQALTINSHSAEVYQSLAELSLVKAQAQARTGNQDDIRAGLVFANKALSINPKLSEALAIEGLLYLLDAQRNAAAYDSAERATQLLTDAVAENSLLKNRYSQQIAQARELAKK